VLFPAYALEPRTKKLGALLQTFFFRGSPSHVYATLAVRLARTVDLSLKGIWKDAACYTAAMCEGREFILGFCELGESSGEISVYRSAADDKPETEISEASLLELLRRDLDDLALAGTVRAYGPIGCVNAGCGWQLPHELQRLLLETHVPELRCPRCLSPVKLNITSRLMKNA
jgi:hypothetical protein